jgi:hypothetical protein
VSKLLDKLKAQESAASEEAASTSSVLREHGSALQQQLSDVAASLSSSVSEQHERISSALSASSDALGKQLDGIEKQIETRSAAIGSSLSLMSSSARMSSYVLSAGIVLASLGIGGAVIGWSWWKAGSIESGVASSKAELSDLTAQIEEARTVLSNETPLLSKAGGKVFETRDSSGSQVFLIAPAGMDLTRTYACQPQGQTSNQLCYRLR